MAATFNDVCNDSGALGKDRQLSYTSIFGVFRTPSRHIIWPLEDPVKVHIVIIACVLETFGLQY